MCHTAVPAGEKLATFDDLDGHWSTDDFVEGSACFLIRTEELAAGRFDGGVAAYQQT